MLDFKNLNSLSCWQSPGCAFGWPLVWAGWAQCLHPCSAWPLADSESWRWMAYCCTSSLLHSGSFQVEGDREGEISPLAWCFLFCFPKSTWGHWLSSSIAWSEVSSLTIPNDIFPSLVKCLIPVPQGCESLDREQRLQLNPDKTEWFFILEAHWFQDHVIFHAGWCCTTRSFRWYRMHRQLHMLLRQHRLHFCFVGCIGC